MHVLSRVGFAAVLSICSASCAVRLRLHPVGLGLLARAAAADVGDGMDGLALFDNFSLDLFDVACSFRDFQDLTWLFSCLM